MIGVTGKKRTLPQGLRGKNKKKRNHEADILNLYEGQHVRIKPDCFSTLSQTAKTSWKGTGKYIGTVNKDYIIEWRSAPNASPKKIKIAKTELKNSLFEIFTPSASESIFSHALFQGLHENDNIDGFIIKSKKNPSSRQSL